MFSYFHFCFVYSVIFCFVFVKSQKPCDGVIGQQFRPDPNDCRVYYLCGTGKDWKLHCGPNLVWNQKLGTCVPLGSGNDTCSQNVQSMPPLEPGPPTASLNFRSPSERRYSPFGESTWRPNCPPGSKQRFAHPTKCAQYYDCGADPRENWWGKNLRECLYPTVFDEISGNCGYYTEVNCGRRELPLDPCDYLGHSCRNSHCVPCFIKYASCAGKRNGVSAWKGREKTPFFVFCKDQRVVFHGQCVPSEPGKRHIFDPQYNTCRRPNSRSPPSIHVTHNEAIHATPEGPIGPQLSPGPGAHRMTPFGLVDIPPNMQNNMSVGTVNVVTTSAPPQQNQQQQRQSNPNQGPQQSFRPTNKQQCTSCTGTATKQKQSMQQYSQNQGLQNQGQQGQSYQMASNNQGPPQASQQNNQNQGFQQSQAGQNTGFQFNNQQPQVQKNNYQSNVGPNTNTNNNNGIWQPQPTRQPQPFTNWPSSLGHPNNLNSQQQNAFTGNGAEAAWLQFNGGKPSQSVDMQQKQTSTFMLDNNTPGMVSQNTEHQTTIMHPNPQGSAQQNNQAGQQQSFQQQNTQAGQQQPFQQQNTQGVNQQQQINQPQPNNQGGYQQNFQQQQQTQGNSQGGNQAQNQNYQTKQQQSSMMRNNQYGSQQNNQGSFQQKSQGGYQQQQQQNTQGTFQQQPGNFKQPQLYRQRIRQSNTGAQQQQQMQNKYPQPNPKPVNHQPNVNIQNKQQQINNIQMEEFMGPSVQRQKIVNNVQREFMGSGITRQRIQKSKMSSSPKSMNSQSNNYQNSISKVPRLHPPNPKSFSYQSVQGKNIPQKANTVNANSAKSGQFMGQMTGHQGQGQYNGNVNQNMRQSQWHTPSNSKRVPSIISNFPQRNQRTNTVNMQSGNRMYQTGNYNPNSMVTIQNNQHQGAKKPVLSEFTQNEVIIQRLKPAKPTKASKHTMNPANPTQYNKYNLITNSPRKLAGFSRRA